jgi:hypothetical protein
MGLTSQEKGRAKPGLYKTFWQSTRLPAGSSALEFSVGVRADFAVQIDFFVLRRGPFHGYDSLFPLGA